MTRLALLFALTLSCAPPFALRAPKTGPDTATERCRTLASHRTAWTVTSAMAGATSAGASPIAATQPAGNTHDAIVIGGVITGVVAALAATLATFDAAAFETGCALSSGAP